MTCPAVYAQVREPDDCLGIEGVTIEITDAAGRVFSVVTNAAGNFYLEAEEVSIAFPISARAVHGENAIAMTAMQTR